MICGNVLLDNKSELNADLTGEYYKWMKRRKVKSFYTQVKSTSLRAGVSALMQVKMRRFLGSFFLHSTRINL
jgi:hypothetical protein